MHYKTHDKIILTQLMSQEWKAKRHWQDRNNGEITLFSSYNYISNNNQQEEQYITTNYDNNIYIEDESPKDTYVTINDINTEHGMNAGKLNVNREKVKRQPQKTCQQILHLDKSTDMHMLLEGTVAALIVRLEPSLYKNSYGKARAAKQCFM